MQSLDMFFCPNISIIWRWLKTALLMYTRGFSGRCGSEESGRAMSGMPLRLNRYKPCSSESASRKGFVMAYCLRNAVHRLSGTI